MMQLGQLSIRCIYIIFQKCVDNFEIEHKTCYFLVSGAVPLKVAWSAMVSCSDLLENDIKCVY